MLFFLPANDKKHPVKYKGVKETAAIVQYLLQHRTTPIGKSSALFSALDERNGGAASGGGAATSSTKGSSGKCKSKTRKVDNDEDDDEDD